MANKLKKSWKKEQKKPKTAVLSLERQKEVRAQKLQERKAMREKIKGLKAKRIQYYKDVKRQNEDKKLAQNVIN
ncbi:hypothetical protein NBO_66g0016 [Nosema bombycis CQ1]|uniref:Uncharacterized protein n=1 Tax=Nosema bombycis (strain CQ1 / CVCC 102059) TaxID=578461 RepID=R0KTK0_NOSB1|nr:hypothetical protein NBO_66g0016 [Nosema bombycis CQ1]|eukprot:EOB13557.1 hypothetical protein NBO_66g0016 [Nosema bombycis CQ1]